MKEEFKKDKKLTLKELEYAVEIGNMSREEGDKEFDKFVNKYGLEAWEAGFHVHLEILYIRRVIDDIISDFKDNPEGLQNEINRLLPEAEKHWQGFPNMWTYWQAHKKQLLSPVLKIIEKADKGNEKKIEDLKQSEKEKKNEEIKPVPYKFDANRLRIERDILELLKEHEQLNTRAIIAKITGKTRKILYILNLLYNRHKLNMEYKKKERGSPILYKLSMWFRKQIKNQNIFEYIKQEYKNKILPAIIDVYKDIYKNLSIDDIPVFMQKPFGKGRPYKIDIDYANQWLSS